MFILTIYGVNSTFSTVSWNWILFLYIVLSAWNKLERRKVRIIQGLLNEFYIEKWGTKMFALSRILVALNLM